MSCTRPAPAFLRFLGGRATRRWRQAGLAGLIAIAGALANLAGASAAPCNFDIVQNPAFTSGLTSWTAAGNATGWDLEPGTPNSVVDTNDLPNNDAISQTVYGVAGGTVIKANLWWQYEGTQAQGGDATTLDVKYAGVTYARFTTAHRGDLSGLGTVVALNGATVSPSSAPRFNVAATYSITLPAGVVEQGTLAFVYNAIESFGGVHEPTMWRIFNVDASPASLCLQQTTVDGTIAYTFKAQAPTNLHFDTTVTTGSTIATISTTTPGTATTYDANTIVPGNQAILIPTPGNAVFLHQTANFDWQVPTITCTDANGNPVAGITQINGDIQIPGSLTTSSLICSFVNTPYLTVAQTFTPSTIVAGAPSTLKMTITNDATNALALSGLSATDSLPSGVVVASIPAASTTCGGGTISAVAGASSFTLSGGAIGASVSTCTVSVDVTAASAGSYVHNIPELEFTTTLGAANEDALPATLVVTAPTLAVSKTDNGPWTIGQAGAQYTVTVSNTGAAATSGTITVTDTLPNNLSANGVPTGTGWSCSVSGGTALTCTSSTSIANGASGAPISVPVFVGPTTPTGTNAISNSANAFGGGDPVHPNAGSAAASPADQTTINAAATLTNSVPNVNVAPGAAVTDTFTLTNTSSQPAKFNVPLAPAITGSGGAIAPSGYIVNGGGPVYTTLAALQSALAALPSTASGAAVSVGVQYTVPANSLARQTITDQLSATATAGGSTSSPANATATDTVVASSLALTKTDNGPWTIGQVGAQYTITPKNTGNGATSGTITVTDTLPANLTANGAPTGTGWVCAVSTGNAITCTSNVLIAAGANGNAITAAVNIGAGTATGPGAISNTAAAYGGADPGHPNAGSAASSPVDQTTINGPAALTVSVPNGNVAPGATATDTFTLTNTAGQNGTFNVPSVPTITAPSGTVTPSGYVLNAGTVYPTLAALQTALGALPPSAGGASVTVGVQYTVPAGSVASQAITDQLFATITAGGATSAPVTAIATDTVVASALGLTKTDNGPWTIGQTGATYTITPRNTGNVATSGTITVTDTLPNNLSANGTPSGTNWACSVAGGNAVTCTSAAAIGAGANGAAVNIAVNVGAGTPTGTNALSNVAAAFGGGDPLHPSAGSPANSAADLTTVNPSPGLTNSVPNGSAAPGASETDTFTLTNASGQPALFNVPSAPSIAGSGGAIAPSGYVVNGGGPIYPTLAALQAALAALPPSANGASVTVGVQYTTPAGSAPASTITDQLSATATAGGVTSAPVAATATDTISAVALTVAKTDNGPWTIGQSGAHYTIVTTNSGNAPTSGVITITDTLPNNLSANGVPSGTGWACAVAGGTAITCTSNSSIAAGAGGAAITVPVTIGAATPIGIAAISNVAGAYGGGDPAHTGPGTAVNSATDKTTINGPAALTIATSNTAISPGTTATDTFVLKNASGQAGAFGIPAVPTITAPGGAITPSGYLLNGGGPVYPSLAALQAALSALPPSADGAGISVGVQYAVPAASLAAQIITDQLLATITTGGATSSPVTATATDTVSAPALALTKTDNGPWTIGQSGARYTITVSNTGNAATSGTITVMDALPSNLTANGAPAGAGWSCTVGGTAVTCTSSAAIAAGAAAASISLAVNVGAGTPTGSNAISNAAKGFGGGDPAHTSAATAANSAPDQTTINGSAALTNTAVDSNVTPGTLVTDTFTLTNTSAQPGTFAAPTDPIITGPGGAIAPAGYTINGGTTVYPTRAALQAALAALAPTPSGGTITVGVQYVVPAGNAGQSINDTFAPIFVAGGTTSPPAPSTAADTIAQTPTLTVTANNPAGLSLALGMNTTDSFTLTNTGSASGTFALAQPTVTASGAAIAPSPYVLTVGSNTTSFANVTGLNAALALTPIPAGASIVVGVTYMPPAGVLGTSISTTVSATIAISSASGVPIVSLPAAATQTDRLPGWFSITKVANTPSAQIGDTVTYAIDLINQSAYPTTSVTISDFLPTGLTWVANSLVASINGQAVAVTMTQAGNVVQITLPSSLAPGTTVHIVYAVTIGPAAVTGQSKSRSLAKSHLLGKSHLLAIATNVATVGGQVNGTRVVGGPATATITLQPSTLDSCGTIVGRAFVDKDGDGREEPGDTPLAHAVIVLDDGTRVQTDEQGLFHVACVHPGWRTGTLDLTSVPGYGIADNAARLDKRSVTISVHLEPSGLARMNFIVVPTLPRP